MKKSKLIFLSSALLTAGFTIAACGESGGGSQPVGKFNFIPLLDSKLYKDHPETIEIYEYNVGENEPDYTFSYIDYTYFDEETEETIVYEAKDYIKVTKSSQEDPVTHELKTVFNVSPNAPTLDEENKPFEIGVSINSHVKGTKAKAVYFTIGERYDAANTGYNFSSDIKKKEEILGELEGYAMKNYLTGITLFENGGYVRYSPRVHLGTERAQNQYVTGYGFGLLTEGYLDDSWSPSPEETQDPEHLKYLQQGTSSDPGNIAGWDAQGSQVSELYGYITSSFYGTRLKYDEEKDSFDYEWFPVLAKKVADPRTGEYDPIPLDGDEHTTIHKKYRIYVKTGELAYNYIPEVGVADAQFHRRAVTLDDYLTTFQVLLTQKTNLFRGAEFAGDDSYGLKGAYSYYTKTRSVDDEQADIFWQDMIEKNKIGIKGGHDENGDFIDFEFKNPLDTFTAKYVLSSNLYSPIPKDFLRRIGKNESWIDGAKTFGTGSKYDHNVQPGSILYNTLCLGPYYLENWINGMSQDFKRDPEWFEIKYPENPDMPRYQIPGVHLRVVTNAKDHDDAIYIEFENNHRFDSTGIPTSKFKQYKRDSDLYVEGDATFKLNVNALDQDTWDQMFLEGHDPTGKYKKVKKSKTGQYNVKDWMSNKHFLNGLFWSINREEFATDRGVTASTNYFSNAYLSDPVNGKSYNSTDAHEKAQFEFDPYLEELCGFDSGKATNEFTLAVTELLNSSSIQLGTENDPAVLDIMIEWMYTTDRTAYGNQIVKYFEDAFNGKVYDGRVKLVVGQHAGSDWQQVYDEHLQVGNFDLGFGAISGNTLSPLNFMEVLKSNNSSGFTLNWGTDTSIVDPDDPITFTVEEPDPENPEKTIEVMKEWSYDAAWAAADHGSVIINGSSVDSVKFGYTKAPTLDGDKVDRLANGGLMNCPFEFVDIDPGTEFEITRIEIVMVGAGSLSIDLKTSEERKWIEVIKEGSVVKSININFDCNETYETEEVDDPEHPGEKITIKYTFAEWINHLMYVGMHNESKIKELDPNTQQDLIDDLENPFSYQFYDSNWWIEVYYNITIEGSVPTENSYSVALSSTETRSLSKLAFAK